TVAELQERLDTVYKAKTLSELEPATWDRPGRTALCPMLPHSAQRPDLTKRAVGQSAGLDRVVGDTPTSTVAIGIMSGATRHGAWVVPTPLHALAMMGGVDLDLTHALFAAREVTITAVALMGGVDIVV